MLNTSLFYLFVSLAFSALRLVFMQEFPTVSKLDPCIYGPLESALTKELVEKEVNGMSFEKVNHPVYIVWYSCICFLKKGLTSI